MLTLPPVEEVHEYDVDGYPMVIDRNNAKLFQTHDSRSRLLRYLPKGATVRALAEAGSKGKVAYYKVRTRGGTIGWFKRWDLDSITEDEAELIILRDQQAFEQSLQDSIFNAARSHIKALGIHWLSHVQAIQLTNEIVPDASGSSIDFGVQALMVGSILGEDKHQIDLTVNVLIHLNRDHLSRSIVEVNRVVLTRDQKVDGLTLSQKLGLLKIVAPMLGILVP